MNISVNEDLPFETQKRLKLFSENENNTASADFTHLTIHGTKTATNAGYKYTFEQDTASSGDIIATKKLLTSTLSDIIQNTSGAEVTNSYSLVQNHTQENDLGTLQRTEASTPREFTINGNGYTFTSSGKKGITVNIGDTLNLTELASFNGFDGSAVTNGGTLNISDVRNAGVISNSGIASFSGYENSAEAVENNSTMNITNTSLCINKLSTGADSTIYIDPAYVEAANVTGDTLSGNILVGKGSVLNLGSMENLKDAAKTAGMTTHDVPSGFTVADTQAVLALNKSYTLAHNARLIVDSAVQNNWSGNTTNAGVCFGNNSLLAINGNAASQKAMLALNGQSVAVAEKAKLYISNAQSGQTYTILSGVTQANISGWQGDNLFMSKLVKVDRIINSGGKFAIVAAKGYDASLFSDTIPYNSIKAMADRSLVSADAAYGGIRFLSRATDTNYLNEADMKPTLNEVSTLASTAAVQHAVLRATDTMTDAVAEHISNTLRASNSKIHEGDADVWATPFYRSLNWSGRNDATGYISGFSFGIDKQAGNSSRVGLAMHYGTGSTEGKDTRTDTKNSSKAIGASLYGSTRIGDFIVIGSVGYTDYDNSLTSYLPSTMNMPAVSATPDASTFTADTRVEHTFKSGTVDITPHAGIRYTMLNSDSYKTYATETESDTQHIVQFPIGVALAVQRAAQDGWKLKGLLDMSAIPVAGDRDSRTNVMFTGINGVWNNAADTAILDACSFRGSIGFTAEKNHFSSNLGYALQTSANETNHTFRMWLNWKLK